MVFTCEGPDKVSRGLEQVTCSVDSAMWFKILGETVWSGGMCILRWRSMYYRESLVNHFDLFLRTSLVYGVRLWFTDLYGSRVTDT